MRKNKKRNYLLLLLLLIVGLSVGYALLQSTLTINGTSKVKNSTWDIHFENLNVTNGSVEIGTGDVAASIQSSTTDITYTVTLNLPGDYYEFTVDAVNAGSVDGMIESVNSKLNNQPITTLPAYLNYSVTYSNGVALSPNQYLKAGDSETYKVRIEFKKDIEVTDLPETTQTLTMNFGVVYVQADENAIIRPISFAEDSWDTIISTVNSTNNCGPYSVGDTKEIFLQSYGNHSIRIANCSRPTECSTEGFSQTACGVVLEFVSCPCTKSMNSNQTNVGGWPSSKLRTFINNDIYNTLPSDLKNGIINTTVVSGHGSTTGETNFTSIDKLYLLSTHEVWEDVDGDTNNGINYHDTSYYNTRQLDYYANLETTVGLLYYGASAREGNYSAAIKKVVFGNGKWWLRSADYRVSSTYHMVDGTGSWMTSNANNSQGVAPAFRIG